MSLLLSVASFSASLLHVPDLHEQPILPHVPWQRHETPELTIITEERAVSSQQIGTGKVRYRLEYIVYLLWLWLWLWQSISSFLARGFVVAGVSLRERTCTR